MICGEEADNHTIRSFLAEDDVAQQQADVGHGLQRLVRQWWVAGTQDAVGRHVNAELLFHRRLYIDVAQGLGDHLGQLGKSDGRHGQSTEREHVAGVSHGQSRRRGV